MKIPEDRMPYEVTINGVKKTYEAGATVADDASVKEIIDNENLFPPKAPDAGKPFDIPIPDPGSTVVANPTLAGDEDSLAGIEIDGTKYAVGGGSGGGVMVVTDTEGTLNKTWQEIYDAATVGVVFIKSTYEEADEKSIGLYPVNLVSCDSDGYYVAFVSGADAQGLQNTYFVTNSADGYPVVSSE